MSSSPHLIYSKNRSFIDEHKAVGIDNTHGISVIVPAYNAERWISRAIESLTKQDSSALEIIIIDDGSNDNTKFIAEAHAKLDERIRVESHPNQGAPAARNFGLSISQYSYILFLDADDYLFHGSLSSWANLAQKEGADMVFGPFSTEHAGILRPGLGAHYADGTQILEGWLEGRGTPPCAVLWRKEFIVKIGGWRPLLKNDDGELGMRGLIEGAKVKLSDEGMGVWVQHDSPDRISRRFGPDVIESEYAGISALEEMAVSRGIGLQKHFARAYYRLAYQGYAVGATEVGRKALTDARRLGLRGHRGSAVHTLFANVFGLEKKMKLSKLFKGFFKSKN